MKRIKIVATIGPGSIAEDSLLALKEAGMSIARLNGSHADLDWHRKAIKSIRKVIPDTPILLDIPGRKIRTTQLKHEPSFIAGESIILTTDTTHDGTEKVPVNYSNLHNNLSAGDIILADDGTLKFTVKKVKGRDIHITAKTDGCLRSRKGINVPYVTLDTPQITPRDEEMVSFAKETGVDFIGLSFVESGAHVNAIRKLISGNSPRIIAKVENGPGIQNVEEIAENADAIMIDRGDLSVETNLQSVAINQKFIINAAQKVSRPVIIATEMLHTMIDNPYPTKAEVSDITNAVLDGCTATMLSGETAVGKFPVEAVELMRNVVDTADAHIQSGADSQTAKTDYNTAAAFAQIIPQLARSLPITKIVAVTRYGRAARLIASHQPKQPIIAVSDDAQAARSFNLIAGTTGIKFHEPFSKISGDHILEILHFLWRKDVLNEEDNVLVGGVIYPHEGSRMNAVQTHSIGSLIKSLDWNDSLLNLPHSRIKSTQNDPILKGANV